jgi:hypothetical protein
MKTQTTLGSFISLILTLAAQPRYAASVAHHPQPEMVPLLPLLRLMVISWSRQMAEARRLECRVFRFSSSDQRETSPLGVLG